MAFEWQNFSKGLAKELARAAGLRVSLAAEDLAAKFGEPPTDTMVQDLWQTLRERWLATRPIYRDRVVAELRKAGLGDTSVKISSKAGQMEYLRSCRQSGRLKEIVLAAFLDEGSQRMVPPSIMVESQPGDGPPEPAQKDTLSTVRTALAEMTIEREIAFEIALRNAVVDFVQKFQPPNTGAAEQGGPRLGASLAVALTASMTPGAVPSAPASPHRDKVVAGARRLAARNGTSDLIAAFIRFGKGILASPKSTGGEVAIMSVMAALSMIASDRLDADNLFGEMLKGSAWLWDDFRKADESEKEAAQRATAESPAPQITHPDQLAPSKPGSLRARVAELFEELTGKPPVFDNDGDMPFGRGSAQLYLRIVENENRLPILRVFGQLVRGVKPTLELLGDINEANRQLVLSRLTFVDGIVVLESLIPAVNLTAHELDFLLDEAITSADHFDTLFAGRHGGSTLFPDRGEVVDA